MTEKENSNSNQSTVVITNFKACEVETENQAQASSQIRVKDNLRIKEVKGEGKKGQVKIDIIINYCKGCEICVQFCPEKVLIMEREVARVVDISKCTKCNICEFLCPDFSISVE